MSKLIKGDALKIMKRIPDKVINCCITSPPYYGLRDYGIEGQSGLESTPEKYVENLVSIFRELKRILRDDGTLWLNLGDSYAGNCSQASNNGRAGYGKKKERLINRKGKGLKPKDLIGIPWRVAFALQAVGWYLRQDIIWNKPNPMPESVRDRCTKAHEYIFLLSKHPKYYYDHETIKEPAKDWGTRKRKNGKYHNPGTGLSPHTGLEKSYEMKNKRSVWTVTTKPFKDAHFATFPPDLILPCVLAGCPENGWIIDMFGGAMTVPLVAKQNNRKYIGIDLNPDYVEMGRKRLEKT